jgi:hypothetical protein
MLPISALPEEAWREVKDADVNDESRILALPGWCEHGGLKQGRDRDMGTSLTPGSADQRPEAGHAKPAAEKSARPKRVPVDCGDLPFVIKRDGAWHYRGTAIGRKELVCLFASVLKRDAEGAYILETPAERGRIAVEDVPFVAVELDWAGDGRQQTLSFRTNVDEVVTAGPDHPIRVGHDLLTCEPTPYLLVRGSPGQFGIEARIGRAVYYELVALAVPEWVGCRRMLGVWSRGKFFPLGELPAGGDA